MKTFGQKHTPNRISRVCRCWVPHFRCGSAVFSSFKLNSRRWPEIQHIMSRVPDICWSIKWFRARLTSESSESSNPETDTKSDTSSNMSSVQVLDQVDCNDPSCVEHGAGDSPDEEETVETVNNNGKVSINPLRNFYEIIESRINRKKINPINLLQNTAKISPKISIYCSRWKSGTSKRLIKTNQARSRFI